MPPQPDGPRSGKPESQALSRYLSTCQVISLISLVLGGVVLSAAAVVMSIIGLRKARAYSQTHDGEMDAAQIMRASNIATAMAIGSLALNVVALVALYPLALDMLQVQMGTSAGSSTWG